VGLESNSPERMDVTNGRLMRKMARQSNSK
jgi:hypothetical protein